MRQQARVLALATIPLAGHVMAVPTTSPTPSTPPFQPPAGIHSIAIDQYLLQFDGKTLEFCIEHASKGNSDAHYCVSVKLSYRDQAGDAESQVVHLRAAAEAGHVFAQNDLGMAYSKGNGASRDYSAAFHWFMRSAEAGLPHAMVSVGWYYMCGLGVAVDYEKARLWNRRGADWDRAEGGNNLGWLYEHGLGGPRDLKAARAMYAKGVELGSEEAAERLANLDRSASHRAANTNDCNA